MLPRKRSGLQVLGCDRQRPKEDEASVFLSITNAAYYTLIVGFKRAESDSEWSPLARERMLGLV